jgi:hypothetical protein
MSETIAIGRLVTDSKREAFALSQEQWKNLALASLGSLLEFYEFMVFGFFTVVIGKLFFPPDLPEAVKTFQAFALFSLGFLLRPMSGAVIGHLGDKIGRKKMFILKEITIRARPPALRGRRRSLREILHGGRLPADSARRSFPAAARCGPMISSKARRYQTCTAFFRRNPAKGSVGCALFTSSDAPCFAKAL